MPGIKKLTEIDEPIRLALSLHAPEDTLRSQIMPINDRYPLAEVSAAMELAESSGRTALGKIILVP